MTGRLPTSGGSIGLLEAEPAEAATTLATVFRRAGLLTALATNQPLLSSRGFTRASTTSPSRRRVSRCRAPKSCARARRLRCAGAAERSRCGGARTARRFLYLQLVEPHQPTRRPRTCCVASRGGDLRSVARYDAEVAAADVRRRGGRRSAPARALDDTLLVVLGTQGEELGEHGDTGSGWTLYDEVLRVPLVLRAPGLIEPGQPEAAASIVDLYPTLLVTRRVAGGRGGSVLDGRPLFLRRGDGSAADQRHRSRGDRRAGHSRAGDPARCDRGGSSTSRPQDHAPAEREAVAAAYFDIVAAVANGEAQAQPLWGPPVARFFDLGADPGEREIWRRWWAAAVRRTTPRRSTIRSLLERYEQHCREQGLAARKARPWRSDSLYEAAALVALDAFTRG